MSLDEILQPSFIAASQHSIIEIGSGSIHSENPLSHTGLFFICSLFRNSQTAVLCQQFHRIHKIQIFNLLNKGDDITASPTAETIKALRIGKYRKRRCFFRMERTIADVGSATPFQIHISACDFFQRTRIPQLFQKHIRTHLLSPAFHRSPHTRRSCGCFPTNHSSSGGNRSATSAKSASNCSPT